MKMKNSQKGVTTIGLVVIIAIFGIIVVTGLKVAPLYLDYMQVQSILDGVAKDDKIDAKSKRDLWSTISKRLHINQIKYIHKDDFSFVRKNGVTTITAKYEVRKDYIAQLFIGANFEYSVELNR